MYFIEYGYIFDFISRLVHRLGFELKLMRCEPVSQFIKREISDAKIDPRGSYLERGVAELERAKDDPKAFFHGQRGRTQLYGGALDLFLAGTDTSATFIEWFILYMMAYPEAQEALRREIHSEIRGPPTLADKSRTPLLQSAIDEVWRHCPEMHVNVPHYALEDTKIKEGTFTIPAGTQIFVCYGGISFDPKFFESPHEFRFDRFVSIADDGRLIFKPDEHVAPFGLGKRRCAGEIFGKAQVYLMTANLLQNFKFRVEDEKSGVAFGYEAGLLIRPKPFRAIVEKIEHQ